jgi:hypothetical protein
MGSFAVDGCADLKKNHQRRYGSSFHHTRYVPSSVRPFVVAGVLIYAQP